MSVEDFNIYFKNVTGFISPLFAGDSSLLAKKDRKVYTYFQEV